MPERDTDFASPQLANRPVRAPSPLAPADRQVASGEESETLTVLIKHLADRTEIGQNARTLEKTGLSSSSELYKEDS